MQKINTPNFIFNIQGKLTDFSQPLIMGIVNVNSDSFYINSRALEEETLLQKAEEMLSQQVDIIDIGACSTRPGSLPIEERVEQERIHWALETLQKHHPDSNLLLSIDTFRSSVARQGIKAGAHIINDVYAGRFDKEMFPTIAQLQVPYVLTHSRGDAQNMNSLASYKNLIAVEVVAELQTQLATLRALGVKDIIIDPGFGFAKNAAQNFQLLNQLPHLQLLECPLLIGISRKRFIWQTLQCNPEQALNGTSILNFYALQQGANILRVHDVKAAKEAILLWQTLRLNADNEPV